MLSIETKTAIKSLGIDLDNYVSNIESKLRDRGETELVRTMLDEIEMCLADTHARRERSRNY